LRRRRRDGGRANKVGLQVRLGHLDLGVPIETTILHLVVDGSLWGAILVDGGGLAARLVARTWRLRRVGHGSVVGGPALERTIVSLPLGVMAALMPSERGTPSEGLATARMGTEVGSLASVGTTMPGQGRGITEGLATVRELTGVRALAGVGTVMNGQGRTLDKLLATSNPLTDVRTLASVDPAMTCEVGSAREGFAAGFPVAFVGLLGVAGRVHGGV